MVNISRNTRLTQFEDQILAFSTKGMSTWYIYSTEDLSNFKFSGWVRNYPLPGAAHALKGGFYAIWDNTSRKEA